MIPITLIRNKPDYVKERLKIKNFKDTHLINEILILDEERRKLQVETEKNQNELKKLSGETNRDTIKILKERLKEQQEILKTLEKKQYELLFHIPNIAHDKVPAGHSANDNQIIRTESILPTQAEKPKPHWELAKTYRLIDFESGTKITGSGFPLFLREGAKLTRALIHYFLDYNTQAGYTEYIPPLLVNEDSAIGTGQLPDKEAQMYHITLDDLYLIPTAEVPLTNIYRNTIIPASDLPLKLTGYTPCFRREAGSYGKDVRGLNRLHQFDKVEIVQITTEEQSDMALQAMITHVEKLILSLKLPYRIIKLCGRDMGFAAAITYDFEVYAPAQEKWLEVSSVSNFLSFQTNRMKIRYKNEQGQINLLHSLNGSSLALPRIFSVLLENGQTDNNTILLPEVLHPYFGKDTIKI